MTIVVTTTASSGLSTYDDLLSSLAGWLNRSDLTARIPDFIAVAESNMNADIDKNRAMETAVTLTTAADTSTVAIPDDMLEMRRLVLLSSPNVVLAYASSDDLAAKYTDGQTGIPESFTVTGGYLELTPTPDDVYSLELTYYQRIPALSSTNQTNWVLTSWPTAYLYGALLAAQPFLMNDKRLPMFAALYDQAIKGINKVDWFSGSTLTVKAR